jgi:xanthine dehydrogenase molybdenum-binding subunit
MEQGLSVVGKRLPRIDAPAKVTGEAKYTVDIKLPGMLFGKVLRSPHAHAMILKIDKSKAEKLPGVEAVITSEDIPVKLFNSGLTDLLVPEEIAKNDPRDQYVLSDKARFVGDAIAAVAARDRKVAEEALDLIEVEYEALPAVFDVVEAMKLGAPRIHDFANGNIARHISFPGAIGDIEKGFQEADVIIEETFNTTKQLHCPLEPSACIASFDSIGRLAIWSPTQLLYLARHKIADIFDIPEGKIRWITPFVGGSFGNALTLRAEPICIALARKTRKPVKLEYSSEEQFIATQSRQPFTIAVKMGVKNDGAITALQGKLTANSGAYYSLSGTTTNVCMAMFATLYRCPNVSVEADIVYTNIPISGGYRGYGNPQAMWALEQVVDVAAKKIGMDPVEFRLKNYRRTGDPGWTASLPIESCALEECVKLGMDKIGWQEKRGRIKEGAKRRGVGMAIQRHVSGTQPIQMTHSNIMIKMNVDGSADLMVSGCEMGQGMFGALAQIAAEEMGLQIEKVHVVTGDTDVTMFDDGQHASRTTYVIGNAIIETARQVRQQLLERASKILGTGVDDIYVRDGQIYVQGNQENKISVEDITRRATYNFEGQGRNIAGKCSYVPEGNPPPYSAVFAEVEVDINSGATKLLKIVFAHDIGRAINPTNVEGQLEGGVMHGIGYALTEEYVVNGNNGVVESNSFTNYKIPSTLDMPDTEIIIVEQPTPSGPFGAKSVGECGLNAVAPAIANAVCDATGARVRDLRITPEKILEELSVNIL